MINKIKLTLFAHNFYLLQQCTASCGGGKRFRTVQCIDHRTKQMAKEESCPSSKRPSNVKNCNQQGCPEQFRWQKTAWGQCSKSCGHGMKNRDVFCVSSDGARQHESMCDGLRKPKPKAVKKCQTQKKCPKWRTGSWNSVST